MTRYLKLLAFVAVLAVAATACGGGGTTAQSTSPPPEEVPRGGTFRGALLSDVSAAFDPQKEYYSVTWEFYRCCLLRTLLSYKGVPADQGGNTLQPDLATAMPEVSSDGLTWTFTLKSGIHYAPPLEDVEITSQDIVRALEREACEDCALNGYSFYYSVIEGFDDFSNGKADSISGVSTPDDHTLVVKTSEPAGWLPYLFSMAATAPIPPNPDNPDARLGVAEGHTRDYGRFLVASGPYMFEGSENLDFSVDPKDQTPVSGYEPGQNIILVRNPSYDPATDGSRGPAYVDRMEISIGGDNNDLYNKVQAGELDMVIDGIVPPNLLRQYKTDPDLQRYLFINPTDGVRYLAFNLAVPPFDDVHVRKAVNLAIDKDGMRRLRGGPDAGVIAGHIVPDGLLNNLLLDYDPYETPHHQGDGTAAKEEMAQSTYDADGEGVCDAPECKNILAITDEADPYPGQAALIQDNLQPLGLTLDVKSFERTTMYNKCNDPSVHMAICLAPGWLKDFSDAYTFMPPLFGSESLFPSCCNYSLVGASPEYLKKYDYTVTEVPSVDDQLAECAPKTGDERVQCYADLDRYLMEQVVPWVPYIFDNNIDLVSTRVVNYSYDISAGLAAFDWIAVSEAT